MSLTESELEQFTALENKVLALANLLKGASSKNQLNRLYLLDQETIKKLTERVGSLETKMQELLGLVRKLQ